eukprot:1791492-Rhodomonas_salina.1
MTDTATLIHEMYTPLSVWSITGPRRKVSNSRTRTFGCGQEVTGERDRMRMTLEKQEGLSERFNALEKVSYHF